MVEELHYLAKFKLRARLVDRVRLTVPLSYSTGCVKYDDEFPG